MLIATFSVVANKAIALRNLQFLKKPRPARIVILAANSGQAGSYASVDILTVIGFQIQDLAGTTGLEPAGLCRDRQAF